MGRIALRSASVVAYTLPSRYPPCAHQSGISAIKQRVVERH
jgi:hypothetical protein